MSQCRVSRVESLLRKIALAAKLRNMGNCEEIFSTAVHLLSLLQVFAVY